MVVNGNCLLLLHVCRYFPFQVALGNDKSNLASIVCFCLPKEMIGHFAKVVLKQIWNTNRELTDNQSNRYSDFYG